MKENKKIIGMIVIVIIAGIFVFLNLKTKSLEGKKILYINSYDLEYAWSEGMFSAFKEVVKKTDVNYRIINMDTKRHGEEDFKIQAGKDVRDEIELYKPDVVISADDNAFKYVVMPYYKDANLPVVFLGVNWDVSVYDNAPYSNTAGMEEIASISKGIDYVKNYSKGNKVGYLNADVYTARKNLEFYKNDLGIEFEKEYNVLSFDEWKESYLKLQNEVDIVFLENNAAIQDWNDIEAQEFILENTKLPSFTINDWMLQFSLLGVMNDQTEFGEWGAKQAIKILKGEPVSEIGVIRNKKGSLMLNLKLADKLGIKFESSLLKNADEIYE